MSTDVIQANYDNLDNLASRFSRRAEVATRLHSRVMRGVKVLEDGAWAGQAATAFFNEMESGVFPALSRLHTALTAGDEVMRQIAEILRAAEQDAARPFCGTGGSSAGGGVNGAAAGNATSGGGA